MNWRKIIMWIIYIFLLIIIAGVIWFILPVSPMANSFKAGTNNVLNNNKVDNKFIISNEDVLKLPEPLQRFLKYSGYIGKAKMSNAHVVYKSAQFKLAQDKPLMNIQYQHYNFAKKPERIAFIQTRMYGIPFEGLDNYRDGSGSMKGVFAKSITLFNSTGKEMNQSSLVTCLSEMIFLPSLIFQDYVKWEKIDDNSVRATMEYYGDKVTGIFKFNTIGEMVKFETNDRYMDTGNGTQTKYKWIVECLEYADKGGIKIPSRVKASWELPSGNYKYFEGIGIDVTYDVENLK